MKRQMNNDINLEELVQENVQQQLRMLGKNYRMGGIGRRSSFNPSSNEPRKTTTTRKSEKRSISEVKMNSDDTPELGHSYRMNATPNAHSLDTEYDTLNDSRELGISYRAAAQNSDSNETPELGHNYRMNSTSFEDSLETSARSEVFDDSRELGSSYRAAVANEQTHTSNSNDEPETLGNSYRMAAETSFGEHLESVPEINETADDAQLEDEFVPPQMLGRNYRTVNMKYRNKVSALASRYRLLDFDDFEDETAMGGHSLTMGTQRSATRKRKSR